MKFGAANSTSLRLSSERAISRARVPDGSGTLTTYCVGSNSLRRLTSDAVFRFQGCQRLPGGCARLEPYGDLARQDPPRVALSIPQHGRDEFHQPVLLEGLDRGAHLGRGHRRARGGGSGCCPVDTIRRCRAPQAPLALCAPHLNSTAAQSARSRPALSCARSSNACGALAETAWAWSAGSADYS